MNNKAYIAHEKKIDVKLFSEFEGIADYIQKVGLVTAPVTVPLLISTRGIDFMIVSIVNHHQDNFSTIKTTINLFKVYRALLLQLGVKMLLAILPIANTDTVLLCRFVLTPVIEFNLWAPPTHYQLKILIMDKHVDSYVETVSFFLSSKFKEE